MVGMVAFSKMVPYVGFRGYIEHFPEIAIEMNADTISVRGTSERPQPDWGTADVVYETTMAIELYCEFAAPQATIAPGVLGGIDVITEAPGPVFGADVT